MKVEIKVPAVGESVHSAVIGSWQKSSGDYVDKDEVLLLLETDKASMEVPSEVSGQLTILKQEGEEVQISEVIGAIDTSVSKPKGVSKKVEQKSSGSSSDAIQQKEVEKTLSVVPPTSSNSLDLSKLSPAVRHAVLEKNIDPTTVSGTGKGGRIKKSDLQTAVPQTSVAQQPASFHTMETGLSARREKMTTIRKRIAERLVASQRGTATLTTFNEVDMTRILALRKSYQEVFQKKYGIKLGFMGFFIKAVIQAMKAYPRVGAQIDGGELVFYDHCHISIAVSTERGLIVPVIRNADQKSVAELEKEVLYFAKKARDGNILPDDLMGGTFTISNGGVFGSLLSTPILNPPQSGILGMHKIEKRPVVVGDNIVVRPMMYLALSYDHRIVDGRESVGFLVAVKECIEEPTRILLDI
ncbi:MAG: 2-oxoglutarate dehydrogenase complex dihydrolipoyllysine-residue succinyltransferase [Bdellovibrionales bacterium]|nr:2-oxoglutarate dehydrogenase complex dihydrolipoyllysine-residue succinyltransferase [Bdellovibrionales bacterium]